MTAPDPRVGEIEAKIGGLCGIIAFPETPEERDAAENELTADVSYLLAELRKAREALARVEALHSHAHRDVEPWAIGYRFGGNHCSHDGQHWPCDTRAAVAAAKGDERG